MRTRTLVELHLSRLASCGAKFTRVAFSPSGLNRVTRSVVLGAACSAALAGCGAAKDDPQDDITTPAVSNGNPTATNPSAPNTPTNAPPNNQTPNTPNTPANPTPNPNASSPEPNNTQAPSEPTEVPGPANSGPMNAGGSDGDPGAGGAEQGAGGSNPGPTTTPGAGGESSPGAGGAGEPAPSTGGAGPAAGGSDGDPPGAGGSPSTEDPFGPDIEGTCTASQPANSNASGSGPYDVVVETNSEDGINEGTIFRPADLGTGELFPIFVWGQGGCSQNGLSNAASMAEIASHGYFVIADGTPNGNSSRMMNTNDIPSMGEPLLAYISWAIEQNAKPCSAYYHSLDATKISANGFSCGGLMSTGTAGDPRITTWGSTSSGTFSDNDAFYDTVHTPVLIIEGGPSDQAYVNGERDYENISMRGLPILWFSKDIGHGGDLFQQGGGDFTRINLAWLNWWLKGDEGETGKGVLVGDGCTYCTDAEWEVKSANLP